MIPVDYIFTYRAFYRGRLKCQEHDCFDIVVSENIVDRGLLFLDTLAKELESMGFTIKSLQNGLNNSVVVLKMARP